MERVNRILTHGLYIECLERNEQAEKNRRYCRHGMEHFLAVARLAMLFNLQEGLGVDKEEIYAAALLHDIGRHVQYERGIPHEQAGAALARDILSGCGFGEEETERIAQAISSHRDERVKGEAGLRGLLYRADKMSRSCFACREEETCNWEGKKKNSCLEW